MISIQPDWQVLIGLAVTVALGFGVGCLVYTVGEAIPIPPPSKEAGTVELWDKLLGQSTGGWWIGNVERILFFAACWSGVWQLLSSWLVFKLALYWQGANFTAFPEQSPATDKDLAWLVARRQLGTHHVATVLVGTGANIVLALLGVAVAKWIRL
jgi:hypothetical protein